MTKPPFPDNEQERVKALHSYNILDTFTETDFDDLTELASFICDVPIALISLVDSERQWFKSHTGLSLSETDRTQSFCAHAIAKPNEMLVVENAHKDGRFANNPLVTGDLNLTFYAGVPLVNEDGFALGSLCVIDNKQRQLSEPQYKALRALARQVMDKLELRRKNTRLQEAEVTNRILQEELAKTFSVLQESETNFRLAMDAANLGWWILDVKEKSLIASDNYKKQMGFTATETISLEEVLRTVDPSYVKYLQDTMEAAIADKQNPTAEYPIRHRLTGELRWLRGVGNAEPDEKGNVVRLIGVNIDITEQKTRERKIENLNEELINVNSQMQAVNGDLLNAYDELTATNEEFSHTIVKLQELNVQLETQQVELKEANDGLYESEEKLRLAIESSQLGTWYINSDTREFVPSLRLKELFGFYPEETMTYEGAANQIREDYRKRVQDAVEIAIKAFGMYDMEYPISGYHDKVERWVRATGKTYKGSDNKAPVFFGTMDDITERKHNELRKNDFINIVSHEMKTPLTVLSGYLQVMKIVAPADDENMAEMADKALVQVRRVTGTVDGFLGRASAESGKIELDKQMFMIGEVVAQLAGEFEEANSAISFVHQGCTDLAVMADKEKISNVVSNFLSNAVKYAPESKVIRITCGTTDLNGTLITVADEGKGIAKREQGKLFSRLYRVKNARTEQVDGQGLGLYLCWEIVRAHGGQIGVDSEEGKGSRFWFTLPGQD